MGDDHEHPILGDDSANGATRDEARSDLLEVKRRLIVEYGTTVPPLDIERYVDAALDSFAGARVRNFIPLLVERSVRDRLRSSRHG
jgi:hypothetical protein